MMSVPPINLIKLRQGFIIERMFPLGVQFVVSVGISAPGISLRRDIIDMVVAARALAELRLVSVFARIPPTTTTHPHQLPQNFVRQCTLRHF